jgi:hypothetical protein
MAENQNQPSGHLSNFLTELETEIRIHKPKLVYSNGEKNAIEKLNRLYESIKNSERDVVTESFRTCYQTNKTNQTDRIKQ